MKKVLYILSNEPTGGVGACVQNYCTHFDSDLTIDFLMYTSRRDTMFQRAVQCGDNRIFYLPELSGRNLPELMKETDLFFRDHAGDYIAVHLHFAGIAALVLPAARKYGIPHRIIHSHNTKLSDNPWKNLRNRLLSAFGMSAANHYFACSKAAAVYLYGSRRVEQNEIYYMYNAVDLSRFCYQPAIRIRMRERLQAEGRHVLFHVGRFEPQKNHSFLLRVFQALRMQDSNAILVLAGDGPLRKETEQMAERLGLTAAVRFIGFTDQVPELLQAADLFLLPSLYEGLPIVAVEAETSGLPCLLSDAITREVALTDQVSFMSLEETPEAWAAEAESMMLRKREDQAGVIKAHGYDISVEARKLEQYYKNLKG